MRITKEAARNNREKIVGKAAQLFRERGFDGVGLTDLMAQAGFTHGGFYNHFRGKQELMAEAAAEAFREMAVQTEGLEITDHIDRYLSRTHRDAPGRGCPVAALAGDAARQSNDTKAVFAAGIEGMIAGLERSVPRAEAISLLAQTIGAMVLSRACPDDSALADELLESSRAACRSAVDGPASRG